MRDSMGRFREFLGRVEQQKRKMMGDGLTEGRWSLKPSVRVMIEPEILCPYCKQGFKDRKTYVVDEAARRVLWAWDTGSPYILRLSQVHPHVGPDGLVCMGDATDVGQALTVGLNPPSAYLRVPAWVQERGHYCEQNPEPSRAWCFLCQRGGMAREMTRVGDIVVCQGCVGAGFRKCEKCHHVGWSSEMHQRATNDEGMGDTDQLVWFHKACIPEGLVVCEGCDGLKDPTVACVLCGWEGGEDGRD